MIISNVVDWRDNNSPNVNQENHVLMDSSHERTFCAECLEVTILAMPLEIVNIVFSRKNHNFFSRKR